MKINLQEAWERKQQSRAGVSDKQGALDAIVSRQAVVGKELADAKDADAKADDTLLAVVQAAPPDRTPVTSDGFALILVGGSLHANQTMPAADVSYDDGSTSPPPDPPTQPAGTGTGGIAAQGDSGTGTTVGTEVTDGGIVLPTEPVAGG